MCVISIDQHRPDTLEMVSLSQCIFFLSLSHADHLNALGRRNGTDRQMCGHTYLSAPFTLNSDGSQNMGQRRAWVMVGLKSPLWLFSEHGEVHGLITSV